MSIIFIEFYTWLDNFSQTVTFFPLPVNLYSIFHVASHTTIRQFGGTVNNEIKFANNYLASAGCCAGVEQPGGGR
jgi:hypothetical protein